MNDIEKRISTGKMSPYQVHAIAICVALYMLDGFDVLVMAFTASSVATDWGLDGSQVGMLLSAGLFGMTAGSLFLAPLADRFGRRSSVLGCLLIISFGMLLSALAQSVWQLAALRFATGLGIGGMLATLTVVVSECASEKWRNFSVSLLGVGYPIGAVIGGVIAGVLLVKFGWRSVFLFGALASFAMIPLVVWRLPESLGFLLVKRPKNALSRVNQLLVSMGQEAVSSLPEPNKEEKVAAAKVSSLFSPEVRWSTIRIWAGFFLVMFSFYFVLSWTPRLLVTAGLSEVEGVSGGVLVNLGGIAGGLLLAYFSSKVHMNRLVPLYMSMTALLMVIFGLFASSLYMALITGVVIGFFLFGSMIGLYTLTPSLYPTSVRTTGMGWGIGMGRLGAISSPIVAGFLLDMNWQSSSLYLLFAIPLFCAALIIYFLERRAAGGELEAE